MRRDTFKKHLYWGLTAFAVVALSIVFFFSLFKLGSLLQFFHTLLSILMPFVYGLAMAYLLIPVFNYCHRRLHPFFKKRLRTARHVALAAKFVSTAISIALALALVSALLSLVLPQVVSSVMGLLESNLLSSSFQKASAWMQDVMASSPQFEAMAAQVYKEGLDTLTAWIKTDMLPQLTSIMSGLIGTLTFFKNVLIGVIIAVYVLNSKELFAAQCKKLLFSCVSVPKANLILDNVRFTHRVFGGFINGKLLDSLIIGILCFFGMTLLRLPYAMLISVIIGVTNIIPFFGPFIGAIPSILLILLINPMQALYFAVFVLVLQQFDGNILGPKILGDSTGLSSFWVMFAILLAGGLFGFVGMVVGVPLFAVLYSVISGLIEHSLAKKELPRETRAYYELAHIDQHTHGASYFEDARPPEKGAPPPKK